MAAPQTVDAFVLICIALAGAGVFVFLVVLVITARPGGHPANAVELAIQILVLGGAVLLVAGRIVRRS